MANPAKKQKRDKDIMPAQAGPCSLSPDRMGYVEWHAMAERLEAKGQRQKLCATCDLWRWQCEADQCAHFAEKEEPTDTTP